MNTKGSTRLAQVFREISERLAGDFASTMLKSVVGAVRGPSQR
jgi:2-phospho-L-lactate guanylyltransferase (CobY/MobA/RfbA family)